MSNGFRSVALAALGLADVGVTAGPPRLTADLRAPSGPRALRSHD